MALLFLLGAAARAQTDTLSLLNVHPTDAHAPVKAAAPGTGTSDLELAFEVKGKIRSSMVDADIWAGGRLSMAASGAPGGATTLKLVRPLDDAWKFFWVNPVIGSQFVNCGSEVAVSAPTWPARAAADKRASDRGQHQYQLWTQQWGGKQPYKNSFAFYIIGDPRDRVQATVSPGGTVGGVVNRLTQRWLPNGWSDWMAGHPQEGYGYWASDAHAPDWEPHAYHGFIAAMALLGKDALANGSADQTIALGSGGTFVTSYYDVPTLGGRVLTTMFPRAAGHVHGTGAPQLRSTVTLDPQFIRVAGHSGWLTTSDGYQYSLTRMARYDRSLGRLVSDHVDVELKMAADNWVSLTIGYDPAAH